MRYLSDPFDMNLPSRMHPIWSSASVATHASAAASAVRSERRSPSSPKPLLRRDDDPWRGESVSLHEFAHGFVSCAPGSAIETRVQAAYNAAKGAGLWTNTYGGLNYQEYWAEGVQSYFDTNLEANPANGIHNDVNTRSKLMSYDRGLYDAIDQFFGSSPWRY